VKLESASVQNTSSPLQGKRQSKMNIYVSQPAVGSVALNSAGAVSLSYSKLEAIRALKLSPRMMLPPGEHSRISV